MVGADKDNLFVPWLQPKYILNIVDFKGSFCVHVYNLYHDNIVYVDTVYCVK